MSAIQHTGSKRFHRGACGWCSTPHHIVIHGGPCPRVKAIEYYPDGTVKRVEFNARPAL